jgi:GT2 family glycosyltransferase
MTSIPLISVCIANYNGMAMIDDCLRSVLGQVGGHNLEIIVHDDASTDGSGIHIRLLYPQVKLICSEANVGFCVANNRMAAAAQGDYLLLLNNDATLYQDALQSLLEEAQTIDKPAILTLPQYDATSGELVDRGCLLDPFYNPVPNLDPTRRDVAMVIGACLWIPRSLWRELEGFPAWFGSIAEDMYLCCRARLAGYTVRALSVSGYRHWQGRSFGGNRVICNRLSSTYRRRVLSERNKTFVMVTTCPTPFIHLLLPLHLLLLLTEGVVLSMVRLDMSYLTRIYLPVFAALWQRWRELYAERRNAMKSRRISLANFLVVLEWFPYKLRMLRRNGLPNVS